MFEYLRRLHECGLTIDEAVELAKPFGMTDEWSMDEWFAIAARIERGDLVIGRPNAHQIAHLLNQHVGLERDDVLVRSYALRPKRRQSIPAETVAEKVNVFLRQRFMSHRDLHTRMEVLVRDDEVEELTDASTALMSYRTLCRVCDGNRKSLTTDEVRVLLTAIDRMHDIETETKSAEFEDVERELIEHNVALGLRAMVFAIDSLPPNERSALADFQQLDLIAKADVSKPVLTREEAAAVFEAEYGRRPLPVPWSLVAQGLRHVAGFGDAARKRRKRYAGIPLPVTVKMVYSWTDRARAAGYLARAPKSKPKGYVVPLTRSWSN